MQVPIVEHSFIDLLQISAGYRHSDYTVHGQDPLTLTTVDNKFKTDTYKLAAEFAPIRDIRFRAAYNRAVRAPNIVELFFPTSLGLSGSVDPCAGSTPSATAAQCALTGVSAAQYGTISANPANQYNGKFGGNANLTPEKADTITLGAIVQPRWIPGLALTADYFNIKIKNLIGAPSFVAVLNACMGIAQTADPTQCARVQRNPANGSLWQGQNGFVVLTNQNFRGVGLFTKGFDFSGSYSRKFGGLGTLNASYVGTLLTKLGSPAGLGRRAVPGSTPSPKWRHKLRVGFDYAERSRALRSVALLLGRPLRRCGGRPGLRGQHSQPVHGSDRKAHSAGQPAAERGELLRSRADCADHEQVQPAFRCQQHLRSSAAACGWSR